MLSQYRSANAARSWFEVAVTAVPFLMLWATAYVALQFSIWLALAVSVVASGFLLRLFMLQHDCGHGALFGDRRLNDWIGRVISPLTLTPYDVWRNDHALHHASHGNLDRRGFGDIQTLTIGEYEALPFWRRVQYRLYRNPFVMFGIGPVYLFVLRNRLPAGLKHAGPSAWVSTMCTNAAIATLGIAAMWLLGWKDVLIVHGPIVLGAAASGVWLFYIQHQFEETVWDDDADWDLHDAALNGSSHYVLPKPLAWLSGHIGIHHVHHLYSRIPFYRLPEVLRDHPDLTRVKRLTLLESLSCLKLRLWDENRRKLISFGEFARMKAAARRAAALRPVEV